MEHNPCDFITPGWDYEVVGKQIRAGEPKNGLQKTSEKQTSEKQTASQAKEEK